MKTKAIAFATIAIFSYLNISASEPAGETAGTGSQPTESAEGRTAETEDQHAESMAANSDALPNDSTVVSLDDLIVVETRKLVQSDGAKLTYNVSEDPEAGSSNILDILRKVPGVSVDAQDNVKVNGQSSFKILKNGHEDVMFKGDIKTILKSLPANSIKKIEVISEPGAKYDAEGVGGILNIVTDNSARLSGFMTQASVWANSYNLGGNLRGMVKLNKVMLDANATYNNGKIWSRKQTGNSTNEYEDGGSRRVLTGDATSRPSWEYGAANVNLSWEPDTLNLFTFSANVYANGWDPVSREKRVMTDGDGVTIWSLDRRVESRGTSRGLNLQASYQHNFGRDDNSLVFSYLYGHDKEDQNQYSIIEESEGYTSAGTAFELPYFHTVSDSRENSHIIQVDYSNEFDDHHRFEAGLKGSLNHTSAQDSENSGATQEDALPVAGTAIDLRQFRDIYALYATYSGNFSRFAVTAGHVTNTPAWG